MRRHRKFRRIVFFQWMIFCTLWVGFWLLAAWITGKDALVGFLTAAKAFVMLSVIGVLLLMAKTVFLLYITDRGLDIYHRSKKEWKRLAVQYRPGALYFCLASSPTIEWDGHLYREVVYLNFIHISDFDIDRCQFVVLRDGEMVENRLSAAQRIVWLTSVLSNSLPVATDSLMNKGVMNIESIFGGLRIPEQVDWHRTQQDILGQYVPEHTWASFLHILEQVAETMRCRDEWCAKTLKVLKAISQEPIPADLIEALDWTREQTERHAVEGANRFLICIEPLGELYQALSRNRRVWARDRTSALVCKAVLSRWLTLYKGSVGIKKQLESAEYLDTAFDQARVSSFQKVVAKKLASYRIPLDLPIHYNGELSKRLLTEEKLDQLVESLPSR